MRTQTTSLVLLCALLSGCGGVSRHSPAGLSAPAAGAASFAVRWPAPAQVRARLIPAAANSIVVTIKRGGTVIASQTLARPAASLTFPALPVGTLSVSATAYPNANGTGAAQAAATAPLVIADGQSTPLTLTLADTVTSLTVTSTAQSLGVGGTLTLAATAYDTLGSVVLTGSALGWTSSNPAVATVSAAGVVSGVGIGSALITVTDSESGISGTFRANCVAPTPFGGTPWAVPGTVEAENYDLGGEGVAYHDTDPGNNGGVYRSDDVDLQGVLDPIGSFLVSGSPGEWLRYTVNVAAADTYTVSFRVACPSSGRTFHLENSAGVNLTGPVASPNTGGAQTWQTVAATVTLPAGVQTLKLVEDSAYNCNFDSMAFTRSRITGTVFSDSFGPYGGSPNNSAAQAFDGDINTFYDCASANGGYTGIDAGAPVRVTGLNFAPRYFERMVGGVFEGSNTSATSGYVTLYTIPSNPAYGLNNSVAIADPTPYRWLRYRGPDGGFCNVSEIQFNH